MRFFSFVKQLTVLPLTFLSKKASGACPTALTGLLHPAPLGTLYACVWTPQNISLYMWPLLGCKNEQASIVVCHQGTSRKRLTQTLEDRKFGLLGTQRLVWKGAAGSGWGGGGGTSPWIPGYHPLQGGMLSEEHLHHSTPPVNFHPGPWSQVEPCAQAESAKGAGKANVIFSLFAVGEAMKSGEWWMRWLSRR